MSDDSTITAPLQVTDAVLDEWATDMAGPVALRLKQKLLSVEESGIIFPPTYADIGYNIDTLSDGTRVATIDSVGSQANRLEPVFKADPAANRDAWLVPQIEIVIRKEDCGKCHACTKNAETEDKKKKQKCESPHEVKRSMLELAHRAADAVVQSSPTLRPRIEAAFQALRRRGDAGPLCEIAPTSFVFGVWDSRGNSGEKRPRLVRSIIRAWDVETLHAAAQFNSLWKALDEEQRQELKEAAKAKEDRLSAAGLNDAPATFRKVGRTAAKYMNEFRDGSPNPERRVLGGLIVRGAIEREVTVNLVALRGLRGEGDETSAIRQYLLGLSLIAATAEVDLFLREGCLLRYAENGDKWCCVPRRGEPRQVFLEANQVRHYAANSAKHFRPRWPQDKDLKHDFNLAEAKKLLAKAAEDEAPEGE